MRIRPGRKRSLFAGIVMLLVTLVGLMMMSQYGGMFGPFIIIWLAVGLGGSAMAFYNAFSEEGLPLYEVDVEKDEQNGEPDGFCPQCGRPVGVGDRFCRHCGAPLAE